MGGCCSSEDQKVEKILRKFPGQPVRNAQANMLQKLVGRVVAAGDQNNLLYAPASGKPCVFYYIEVEEEIQTTEYDDESGTSSTRNEWSTILTEETTRDFYLQDGVVKILVNGFDRDHIKISSEEEEDESHSGWFSSKEPPQGIRQLVGLRQPGYGWPCDTDGDGDMETRRRTGDLRWTEKSFDLNEILACLGVPAMGVDPYTQQPVLIMQPLCPDALTEEYFEQNGWESGEKKAWNSMTDEGAVLVSDKDEFTDGIDVLPVVVPNFMVQPLGPGMAGNWAPLQNPVVMAPIPIQTYVMPVAIGQPVAIGSGQVVPVQVVPVVPVQVQ